METTVVVIGAYGLALRKPIWPALTKHFPQNEYEPVRAYLRGPLGG